MKVVVIRRDRRRGSGGGGALRCHRRMGRRRGVPPPRRAARRRPRAPRSRRRGGGGASSAVVGLSRHDACRVRGTPGVETISCAGWQDPALMAHNLDLFRHALEPLVAEHAATLRHVSLLQGAKAYGLHVGRSPVPGEGARAHAITHDNFYFLQEDALRALADGASWSWTVLRPQVVVGESFGSPMNLAAGDRRVRRARARAGRGAVVSGRPAGRTGGGRRPAARPGAGLGGRGSGCAGRDLQRDERRRVLLARRVATDRPTVRHGGRRASAAAPRGGHARTVRRVGGGGGPVRAAVAGRHGESSSADRGPTPTSCSAGSGGHARCLLCSAPSRSAKQASPTASTPRTCSTSGWQGCRSAGSCLPDLPS